MSQVPLAGPSKPPRAPFGRPAYQTRVLAVILLYSTHITIKDFVAMSSLQLRHFTRAPVPLLSGGEEEFEDRTLFNGNMTAFNCQIQLYLKRNTGHSHSQIY